MPKPPPKKKLKVKEELSEGELSDSSNEDLSEGEIVSEKSSDDEMMKILAKKKQKKKKKKKKKKGKKKSKKYESESDSSSSSTDSSDYRAFKEFKLRRKLEREYENKLRHKYGSKKKPDAMFDKEFFKKYEEYRKYEAALKGYRSRHGSDSDQESSRKYDSRKDRSPPRKYERSPSRKYDRERSPSRKYDRERSPSRKYDREYSPQRKYDRDYDSYRKREPHRSNESPRSYESQRKYDFDRKYDYHREQKYEHPPINYDSYYKPDAFRHYDQRSQYDALLETNSAYKNNSIRERDKPQKVEPRQDKEPERPNTRVCKSVSESDEEPQPSVALVKPVNSKQLTPIMRKDYGTVGNVIKLQSNYYEVNVNSSVVIYQYDVDMEERIMKVKEAPAVIMRSLIQNYSCFKDMCPVYDGMRILYTNKRIPELNKRKRFTVTYEKREVDVKISPTNNMINLSAINDLYQRKTTDIPLSVFSCAEIILGFLPKIRYTSFNRCYFPPQTNCPDLGRGIQLWSGCAISVKPGQWKVMVNIDEKHTAFYKKQPLLDLINEICPRALQSDRMSDSDIRFLNSNLRGLNVATRHLGYKRVYRVVGLYTKTASEFYIEAESMSIKDFFERKYQIQLRQKHLPLLQVEPKKRNMLIPLELAEVKEGQRCIRNLGDDQIAKIIRTTAKKPHLKRESINNCTKDILGESKKLASDFGFELHTTPVLLKGRVLPTPVLIYGNNEKVTPRNGCWSGGKFKDAKRLDNWAVVCMAPKLDGVKLHECYRQLRNEGQKVGINVEEPCAAQFIGENSFKQEIDAMIQKFSDRIEYVIVILPPRSGNNHYSLVKEIELTYGIATQCIKIETYMKKFKSKTLSNILMKTNTKLGGQNWEIESLSKITDKLGNYVFSAPVMIIGADVTHWKRNEGMKPSLAGVVATLDNNCSNYASKLCVQPPRKNKASSEIIENFKEIMLYLLKRYYEYNRGVKPCKIIYFRDGVSGGQFIQTLTKEIAEIQAACRELEEGYQPQITYINAQKRHHTKLFCTENRDADRSGNIPPGTVVDTDITSPILFDFFLNSHSGIQGTNRPCHYTVLWDDSDFSPDFIQLLTYYLCHVYNRCTRSVSYPAPTYYAHLLCARARTMLLSMRIDWSDEGNLPSSATIEKQLSQHANLRNCAYFV